jgi:hypothetical protein
VPSAALSAADTVAADTAAAAAAAAAARCLLRLLLLPPPLCRAEWDEENERCVPESSLVNGAGLTGA